MLPNTWLLGWVQALNELHLGLYGAEFDAFAIYETNEESGKLNVREIRGWGTSKITKARQKQYRQLGAKLKAVDRGIDGILVEDTEVVLIFNKVLRPERLETLVSKAAEIIGEFLDVAFTDVLHPNDLKSDFGIMFQTLKNARTAVREYFA